MLQTKMVDWQQSPEYTADKEKQHQESGAVHCRSMFDTSKRRKVSGSSKIEVWSNKPTQENYGVAAVLKENTYQLGPYNRFQSNKAKEIAEQVVQDHITKVTCYNPEWARHTSLEISAEVQKRLKLQRQERYKFVVQTFIGQRRGQGVLLGSRCLSNLDTDSHTEFSFHNSSLWCSVLVYAMYYE